MIIRSLFVVLALSSMAWAPTAGASTASQVPTPGASTASQAAAALGVTIVYGPCPSPAYSPTYVAGCTYSHEPVVYVDDPNDTGTLLHEIGHQFAFRVMGDTGVDLAGGMRKFARLTRAEGDGPRSMLDVREQFADAFATCVLGQRPRITEWGYVGDAFPTGRGYAPTPHVQRQVCGMVERLAARLSR